MPAGSSATTPPADNRIDTGVISALDTTTDPSSMTLTEADGLVTNPIPFDSTAQVLLNKKASDVSKLSVGMSVVAIGPAGQPLLDIWATAPKKK